jgi:hypothetical protein
MFHDCDNEERGFPLQFDTFDGIRILVLPKKKGASFLHRFFFFLEKRNA